MQILPNAEKTMIERQNTKRSDRENNERWAYNMQKYWHNTGHTNVQCVAVESAQPYMDAEGHAHTSIQWGVATNLVNGLPPV